MNFAYTIDGLDIILDRDDRTRAYEYSKELVSRTAVIKLTITEYSGKINPINVDWINLEVDEMMAAIDESAVNRAIKIGACNIYHGCVHNMLHEKNEDILRGLYKSASFVVQAIVFQQTGNYSKHQEELLQVVYSDERVIVETFLNLKNGGAIDFDSMSEILFAWSKKWIAENS